MKSLHEQVEDLVAEFGLEDVYFEVKNVGSGQFCGNCGCPKTEGERHVYMSMGGCVISEESNASSS